MSFDLQSELPGLIAAYGYWLVGGMIALESMGLPLPGETTLIAASLYAGSTHRLSIVFVVLAGMAGAVIGDNIGYWIGRRAGFPLLLRYGARVGLDERRLKLGQYLFLRHGGKVVFFGRFVALLRALAALLAGANRMEWRRFLGWNAAAAVVWVGGYGLAAFLLGGRIRALLGPVGLGALALALLAGAFGYVALRRREAEWQEAAERAFPGPLAAPAR